MNFTDLTELNLRAAFRLGQLHWNDRPMSHTFRGPDDQFESMERDRFENLVKDARAQVEQVVKDENQIQQVLGRALGFPWYKDDQENFPGSTEADGVCVGDHVAATLAADAAERIVALETALKKILAIPNYKNGLDWEEITKAREIAAEALGVNTDVSVGVNASASVYYEVIMQPGRVVIKCHSESIAKKMADELVEDDGVETTEVNRVVTTPLYRRDMVR